MSFVSGFGRVRPGLALSRAKAADKDGQHPPYLPRRAKDGAGDDAPGEDFIAEQLRKPELESAPNRAEAELWRFGMHAQPEDADHARHKADAALARMRTAQMVRAVEEASRISGVTRPEPGLTGEILGPEDAGGDDAQVIASGQGAEGKDVDRQGLLRQKR
ncbi:hypothetical protein KUD11_01555 [Roseovarius sp. LXJ103]|uniref:hypothetical protein n=1 Tax=Roseovarius carneus TaxID=2853164 RepID=UPI000D60D014|nr:hypothetical protein [Roseovarius carneus]MBZ8117326.1 hypothetical protein [Roseovarius carneus]PWE36850.1 hypothetical protein DD563_13375 [Pelagicola sp. LXJ1103]